MDTGKSWGEYAIFGFALVTLTALTVWWSAALVQWVDGSHARRLLEFQHEALERVLRDDHGDFELRPLPHQLGCSLAKEGNQQLCPPEAALVELEAWRERRIFMVRGELALLVVLLLIASFMLLRLIRSERRFREEMSFFLGRVTHDMKTPLAGLKALLQSLKEGRVPVEDQERLLLLGLEQVAREERLVSNLLTAQRMRAGAQRPVCREFAMDEVLEKLVAERRQLAQDSKQYRLGQWRTLTAWADQEQVLSIVHNLLDNAEKCGATEMELSLAAESGQMSLTCRDNGQGFPPHEADRLFDAFVRASTDAGEAGGGVGLGLYLCRRLAQEMGGDVTAQSDGPGQGACFTLRLPLTPSPGASP